MLADNLLPSCYATLLFFRAPEWKWGEIFWY